MGPPLATILCVDDDAAILKQRKLLLTAAGYLVVTASSGKDALALLGAGQKVDLVVLDFRMPGMNGDELAEKLREKYPQVRLVAMSAVEDLPPRLLDAVDNHVLKGQDPQVLLSIIASTLGPAKALASKPPPPANTILCVEDEELQLQLRKTLFESEGFRVLLARRETEALDLFRSEPVDAVVMDYWLSGRNGTAIAEEMKRMRPKIPIVMLSGFSSLPGEGAVVDAWLRKAYVEPQDLVAEIRRLIGRREKNIDRNHA